MSDPQVSIARLFPFPTYRVRVSRLNDAKDPEAKYPPIRDLRPPAGAPNVLLILIDDGSYFLLPTEMKFSGPVIDHNGVAVIDDIQGGGLVIKLDWRQVNSLRVADVDRGLVMPIRALSKLPLKLTPMARPMQRFCSPLGGLARVSI